jgi:hypothetical protein
MMKFNTQFDLPPGAPSSETVRAFLDLALRGFRWFEPRRYGHADLANPLSLDERGLDALVAYYEEHRVLCVAARTDRDFIWIFPTLPDAPPYTGSVSWMTSASSASKTSWRAAHAQQVAEIMRLVQSPLAVAGLETDLDSKQWRLIDKSIPTNGEPFTYSEKEFTVRDYSQGLAGLFWRNFYGPPFVRMFGPRLRSLPPDSLQPLGEELVLVQPYALPTEAGTEASLSRERELIQLLGPECFYDHQRHTLPTRVPTLDSLGQPLH